MPYRMVVGSPPAMAVAVASPVEVAVTISE